MQVDFLTARTERLKRENNNIAALDAIRLIRHYILREFDYSDIVTDELLNQAMEMYNKGLRPFQDPGFLNKLNWKKCTKIVREFLKALREAGMQNGSIKSLLDDLDRDKTLAYHLCYAALDPAREHIEYFASKYRVEPELLRLIATTPLVPFFTKLREIIPPPQTTIPARACTLCGARLYLGVYQAGFRLLMCAVCGHKTRVDFFYCANCGNTDPATLGFLKIEREPIVQVDYCRKCGSYYKMVNEDIVGSVEDPILLDLSTMDLDAMYREHVLKSGEQSE